MAHVKVKLVFKSAGFRAILRGQSAVALCADMAKPIAERANSIGECEGFESRASVGANRARAVVASTDMQSVRAEAECKALTRALGSA